MKETKEKINNIQSNKENRSNFNENVKKKSAQMKNSLFFYFNEWKLKGFNEKTNERLLKNSKILSDGVDNLKYAKKNAYEAENMAINITSNLHKQTGQMESNITKV